MIMRRAGCAAVAAVLAWGSASAQEAESSVTVVEELVARPLTPGPAWWRVADADSAVYIMTVPASAPKGQDFDRTVLERRLDGAKQFIKPFDLSLIDPRSILGAGALLAQVPFMLGGGPKPRSNPKPLEEMLPPDVRARFVAFREDLGHPAERYAAMSPLMARSAISRDFRSQRPTAGMDLVNQVEAAAKRHRVPILPAYKLRIPAMKVQRFSPTPGREIECLDRALRTLKPDYQAITREAAAWAQGDVRRSLPVNRNPFRADDGLICDWGVGATIEPNSPLGLRLEEEFVTSQVRTLEQALRKPGRSVAVLMMESPTGNLRLGLLGTNGVLVRLKAKGYEVTGPAGILAP